MPTTVTMTSPGTTTIEDAGVDYSGTYTTIATALGTIATNSTSIKDNIALIKDSLATIATQTTTLATQTTTVASQTTTLASNSTTITGLATGNGIHIIGAYDGFGLVTLYKLLVEQAKILDTSGGAASPEQIQASLNEITRVVSQIRSNIPKEF
jgi:hypothetical protein